MCIELNIPKWQPPGSAPIPKVNTRPEREKKRAETKAENAQIRKRAEREAGVAKDDGSVPPAMREGVFARDKYTCQGCGVVGGEVREDGTTVRLHADHIKPWKYGGPTVKENLITRCDKCNLGKGAKRNAEAEQIMLDKAKANAARVIEAARMNKPGANGECAGSSTGKSGSGHPIPTGALPTGGVMTRPEPGQAAPTTDRDFSA